MPNMTPIVLSALFQSLTNDSEEMAERVQGIIEEAKGRGLTGNRLHFSLVYSGMNMGVDSVESRYDDATAALAAAYREIAGELQKVIPLVDDTTALETLNTLREKSAERAAEYGKSVAASYAKQMSAAYGIEEKFFTSGQGAAMYDAQQLMVIGYTTSTRAQEYFAVWLRAHRENVIKDMPEGKCRCANCLHRAVFKGKPANVNLDEEFRALSQPQLNSVFADWARFLLDTLQNQLIKELGGEGREDHGNAEELTKNFLDTLLKDPGRLPPEDE